MNGGPSADHSPAAVGVEPELARAKGASERVELGKRAQATARRAAESKATVPHLYLGRTTRVPADFDAALLIAAAGRVLREHRGLNGAYRDGALERYSRVNVGLVVETGEDTLVPTVFDADTKSVSEIRSEIAGLSEGAGAGTLASPALSGGTFTVSVMASGADRLLPPVRPGQAAHLGVGRSRRAIVPGAGGQPVTSNVIDLSLSCDARAVRPPLAAAFLEHIAQLLSSPEEI